MKVNWGTYRYWLPRFGVSWSINRYGAHLYIDFWRRVVWVNARWPRRAEGVEYA